MNIQSPLMAMAIREAQLRSRRIGRQEIPGALPNMNAGNSGRRTMSSEERRNAIIAAIGNARMQLCHVTKATGFNSKTLHAALRSMERDGLVKCIRQPNKKPLWHLPKGKKA